MKTKQATSLDNSGDGEETFAANGKSTEANGQADSLDSGGLKTEQKQLLSALLLGSEEEQRQAFEAAGYSASDLADAKSRLSGFFGDSDKDLTEIRRLYPFESAKRADEISNADKYKRFRAAGLTAVEAYEAANAEAIIAEKTRINAASLQRKARETLPLSGKGAILPPIPQNEYGLWKSAFPKDSEEALRARYNRNK